jgi:hypothetical protein
MTSDTKNMRYKNPWPPVAPIEEEKYDIELTDGTCIENVEYWGFGDRFEDNSSNIHYPLKDVVSFSLTSVKQPIGDD